MLISLCFWQTKKYFNRQHLVLNTTAFFILNTAHSHDFTPKRYVNFRYRIKFFLKFSNHKTFWRIRNRERKKPFWEMFSDKNKFLINFWSDCNSKWSQCHFFRNHIGRCSSAPGKKWTSLRMSHNHHRPHEPARSTHHFEGLTAFRLRFIGDANSRQPLRALKHNQIRWIPVNITIL